MYKQNDLTPDTNVFFIIESVNNKVKYVNNLITLEII